MRRLLPRSIVLRYCSSNNRPPPSSCGWSAPAAARTRGYHASSTRYVRQQQQQQQRSTPKLAYEWIVDGKVVPPSSSADDDHRDILVPPPPPWGGGGEKKEVIVFLHGLLGNAKVSTFTRSFFLSFFRPLVFPPPRPAPTGATLLRTIRDIIAHSFCLLLYSPTRRRAKTSSSRLHHRTEPAHPREEAHEEPPRVCRPHARHSRSRQVLLLLLVVAIVLLRSAARLSKLRARRLRYARTPRSDRDG